MLEPTVLTALISAGVGVVTAIVGYLTAKNSAKKDIFVTDRQQLSQDQQQLRAEMREELKYWREKYDRLEEQMDGLVTTNVKLQAEVELWKEKYEHISKENEILTKRVSELEGELRKRHYTE